MTAVDFNSLKSASITVDLDPMSCYHEVHGLNRHKGHDPTKFEALERLSNFFDGLEVSATLFIVASTLDQCHQTIADLVAKGHEPANHTFSHHYDLASMPPKEIAREVVTADERIQEVTGRKPSGFRAPGYTLSRVLLEAVHAAGYDYDSSIFPCFSYGFVKNAVRRLYAMRGRNTASVSFQLKTGLAPKEPYLTDSHVYWKNTRGRILEIPISVAPWTGMPALGTLAASIPFSLFKLLVLLPCHSALSHITLEFHAMDFVAASDRGVTPALAAIQPELKVPLEVRLEKYASVVRWLTARRRVGTLQDMVKDATFMIGAGNR